MPIERRQSDSLPQRVLLIGWDAADWQMIHPLVEQGLMPTLAGFMERGAWGNLATTRPILSPMLWNTIATGKRPQHHGVYGFTEPNAEGTGVQPTSSTTRKCKALWNILTQNGLRSNVVGWYASHPAEPIHGVAVSNQFEQYGLKNGKLSEVPSGAVHPAELAKEIAPLRVLPAEVDATAILPFVPEAEKVLQRDEKRLGKLQHMMAQTATVHAVATELMASTEWDFTAVYYEGIDRFGHEFMEFHPPKMNEVSQEDFEAYQHCMTGIYRFHDMMLQTLLTLAGDDTAVILMSDHGYYNDHLRPDPREGKAGPVDWHRPFGILAAGGPGVKQGTRLYGASILDVTPTVLQLAGLPAAYDMPGRVLAEVLEETKPIPRIESWEEIEGDAGMHPEDIRVDPMESRAALEQLVALGYIEAPGEDAEKTVRDTIGSNMQCLAQSLLDAREFEEAIEVVDGLDEDVRSSSPMRMMKATCLIGTGKLAEARALLEPILEQDDRPVRVHMMLGSLEFAEGRPEEALDHLRVVEQADPRLPGLHNKLGDIYLQTKRYPEAMAAFGRALSIDGESPAAFAGVARAQLEMGNFQEALDQAMTAAELVHYFPRVHYVIGKASLMLGDTDTAAEALELTVKQAPRMRIAHEALAEVYRQQGRADKAMAAEMAVKGITKGA